MVHTSPDSAYVRLLKPFLEKKKRLGVDKWGRDDSHIGPLFDPILDKLRREIPERFRDKIYPPHWKMEGHFHRVLREMLVSQLMTFEYASYFEGKTFEELEDLAASFKLGNCQRRDGLNDILRDDAGLVESRPA